MKGRKYHCATSFSRPRTMFHGSIVALITPMNDRGDVDESAWRRLLDWHLEQGTDGVVVAGTTGESATLTGDEFRRLLEVAVDQVGGRLPVIAGTGTADTAKTIERSLQAAEIGADGLLAVTPYYVRPMQSGLVAHFSAIADAVPLPLLLYNVPTRTAVDLLPETTARLSRHERIVGIKEAVPDAHRIARLRTLCSEGFLLISGDDPTAAASLRKGAVGVISVAANLAPALMGRLCRATLDGREEEAGALLQGLQALFEQLAVESNPIPVKWAAWRMGLVGPGIRLPLLPLDKTLQPAMEACLAGLELLPEPKT